MRNSDVRTSAHAPAWRSLCLISAVIVAAGVLLSGCGRNESEAIVTRRDVVAYLALEGEIAAPAAARADILPPYDAPVDEVYVTVGKAVQKGDVVMRLSAPESEAYYRQARQRLLQARQNLQQAEQRYDAQISQAQQELEQARETERQARQAAQADGGDADGEVVIVDGANPELGRAIARRRAAEQAVLDARARKQEGLVPYQRRLAEAEQAFQEAQSGVKAASVRTPITGTVLEVNAAAGDRVTRDQAQPVVRVVDLDALKVYAPIDDENVGDVEPGDPAVVTLAEPPDVEFPGTLQQVYSEEAGFLRGQEYTAVVDFTNERGRAKPGMEAVARVRLGEAEDVLAVPNSAVYESDGGHAVRIRSEGEWRERIVEIGLVGEEYTEIQSGLQENDVVQANP